MPYDDEQEAFLAQCENMVKEIEIPQEDANVAGHLEQLKGDVLGLIESIRGGEIRTSIRTKLPYKMTNTDAEIHLVVDGIEVEVKAKHQSQGSTIPIAQVAEGTTMATTGPSKWTTTTCDLEIVAHCLTDILEERPKVILRGGADDGGYWTAVFDFTFKVVCAIWTYVHQQEEVTGAWPPSPNDIQYL